MLRELFAQTMQNYHFDVQFIPHAPLAVTQCSPPFFIKICNKKGAKAML